MSRTDELLELAAAALRDGLDPLYGSFLAEHDVALDEAYELSDQLALGADLVRALRGRVRDLTGSTDALVRSVASMRLTEALTLLAETR